MHIGIFGGSFNPIHIGHLIVAEEVFQQRALSKVVFIPTGISPHKESRDLIDAAHRYHMVKEAIRDNEHFEISDLEIKRTGKSYTIDTIKALKELYGEKCRLYVIIGSDMVQEISTWKDIHILFTLCRFIVVNRPPSLENRNFLPENALCNTTVMSFFDKENGNVFDSLDIREGKEEDLVSGQKADIESVKVRIPLIGISSTEIRNRLHTGRSIRYLVPRCVEDYIKAHDLYTKK